VSNLQLSPKKNVAFKLKQSLYFPTSYPLVFVNNAIVACSSIKKSICVSSSPSNYYDATFPHDRYRGPFENNVYTAAKHYDDLRRLTKFGFVRNPYYRFISAYQDKIARPKPDPHVWKILSERYGFNITKRPSPEDVLKCIIADDEYVVDQHFAKQKVNLSIGIINFDYIGQLERPNIISNFFSHYNINLHSHQKHSTKASSIIDIEQDLGKNVVKLIQEFYEDDFHEFGYDFSPKNTHPLSEVVCGHVDDDIMKLVLKMITSKNLVEFKNFETDLLRLTDSIDTNQIKSEKFGLA
jgi:hypothetical protein